MLSTHKRSQGALGEPEIPLGPRQVWVLGQPRAAFTGAIARDRLPRQLPGQEHSSGMHFGKGSATCSKGTRKELNPKLGPNPSCQLTFASPLQWCLISRLIITARAAQDVPVPVLAGLMWVGWRMSSSIKDAQGGCWTSPWC